MMKTQHEIDEEYEWALPWIELWGALLQYDLQLFEPDGLCIAEDTGNSIGIECLIGLRTYFENIESYRRAGRVHRLIQEYQERWPDAPLSNSGL